MLKIEKALGMKKRFNGLKKLLDGLLDNLPKDNNLKKTIQKIKDISIKEKE